MGISLSFPAPVLALVLEADAVEQDGLLRELGAQRLREALDGEDARLPGPRRRGPRAAIRGRAARRGPVWKSNLQPDFNVRV